MTRTNRHAAGDDAVLIELGDVGAAELHALAAQMRADANVLASIVGHSSLYVIHGRRDAAEVVATREPREWRIPVAFDGIDLPELFGHPGGTAPAQPVGMPAFLNRVRSLRLTVRYLGFRAGFAYLDGWPSEWAMPRQATSRPVARGSFAIAGNVAGFYPIDTPGGWNLLGHTDVDLENALIAGDTIVIEPVDAVSTIAKTEKVVPRLRRGELVQSPLTTIVAPRDWSRIDRGLPPGGPFDDIAAERAMNAVRGDVELLECAIAGPRIRFVEAASIAWCTPDLALRVETVRAGEERAFGRIEGGLRAYLAIGAEPAAADFQEQKRRDDRHVIRAIRGPHDVSLREVACEVTSQLDRVGIRLRPLQSLQIEAPGDLRSIGMQMGTVQLHPDGSLVAMGPDHPVTGGYLQPMTVIASERWKLAQLVPGERVVLRAQDPY